MATIAPLPRVNASNLKNYIDKRVLLIGKLDSQTGSESKFLVSDGAVNVHIGTAVGELEIGGVYQIMGQVSDDVSLKAFQVVPLNGATELPPKDLESRLLALRGGPAKAAIFMPEM